MASTYSLVFLGITIIIFSIFQVAVSKINKNISSDFYGV